MYFFLYFFLKTQFALSMNIVELDGSIFPCRQTSSFLGSDIKGAVLYLGFNFPLFEDSFGDLIP